MPASLPPINSAITSLLSPTGINSPWGNNDVAVYLSAGQSNDLGFMVTGSMDVADQITTPMANVKGLSTTYHQNLTFSDVTWEGYTSYGKMNLGMANADHRYCAATEFARLWQAHITAGNSLGLPDLYVVRMATGGQSIYPGTASDGWSFVRNNTDVASLFPRYMKTLRLALANLRASGKNPRILLQNWNQWEAEADAANNNGTTLFAKDYAAMHYLKLIQSIRDATGCPELRFDFYYPMYASPSTTYTTANIDAMRKALTTVIGSDPQHLGFNDVRKAPHYTGVSPSFGIYQSDNLHYNKATHQWFAAQQFARITAGDKGVPGGLWPHGTRPLAVIEADVATAVAAIKYPTSWFAQNFPVGTNIATQQGLTYDVGVTNYTFTAQRVSGTKSIAATRVAAAYSFIKANAVISDTLNGELVVSVQSGSYPAWLGAAFRVSANGVVGGGFQGVPYSYLAINFSSDTSNTITAINCWCLFNATLDASTTDRLFQVTTFANPIPTGKHKMRFRIVGTTAYVQSSVDGGVTWKDHLTSDNTASGTSGKTFAFDATRHASLVNVKTGGGVGGLIMGLGTNASNLGTGVLDGFEFNPLP